MKLFGRSSRKQATDPSLGLLTQDRHGWSGSVAGPDKTQRIWLRIDGTDDAPNESIGRAVLVCLGNYASLSAPLSRALFSLWQPYLDEPLWGDECPTSPEMLWAQLQLEGVEVQRSCEIVLVYAFKGEVWPEAVFSVQVDGTDVKPLSLED
ncbi:hypothetical protein [Hydrogenophaga sp. RWCD_12]|uniref:hypothetical protein n=1 Tax=Hydrogenophaga sp. RWCD_12 TaxID=3391190 RepID=UPI003985019F